MWKNSANGSRKKVFFYLFRLKENAGKIFFRVQEWSIEIKRRIPQGDWFQDSHVEGKEIHSRRVWRLQGVRHSLYPGIQEGFKIEKTNLTTLEIDQQYFISNRPAHEWDSQMVLDRILLHWDTETGVFGIKDVTFGEDKVRYASIAGAMAHVSLLNFSLNCLSAPVFKNFWSSESMNCRIQFWKDNPRYNPFVATY